MPIVRLWLACGTQWNIGFAGAAGLNYPAVYLVAGSLGVEMDAKNLRKLNILEGLTLEHWRLEREREARKNKRRA